MPCSLKMDGKVKNDFDLQVVLDAFQRCRKAEDDSVMLEEYLDAFKELCRFVAPLLIATLLLHFIA